MRIVAENGNVLAESAASSQEPQLVTADIDLDRLVADRIRTTSFVDCLEDHRGRLRFRRVRAELDGTDARYAAAATGAAVPVRARRPVGAGGAVRGGLRHPAQRPARPGCAPAASSAS